MFTSVAIKDIFVDFLVDTSALIQAKPLTLPIAAQNVMRLGP